MASTEVITAIQAVGTDVASVGAAIILIAVAVMAFRWIKASFF